MHSLRACLITLALCAVIASCNTQPAAIPINTPNTPQASVSKKVPEASFGSRQIDQMLEDRPDMVGILSNDDPILLWIIDGLNGDRVGQRVYWNAHSPWSGAPSEFVCAYASYPPHICVSGSTDISATDKWAALVFELFNLENSKAWVELWSQAWVGKVDSYACEAEGAKLEYLAFKKARKFFEEYPLPNWKPDRDVHYDHILETPATFDEYLAKYYDSDGVLHHPGTYFKDYYDTEIAPYIKSKREFDKAPRDYGFKSDKRPR